MSYIRPFWKHKNDKGREQVINCDIKYGKLYYHLNASSKTFPKILNLAMTIIHAVQGNRYSREQRNQYMSPCIYESL